MIYQRRASRRAAQVARSQLAVRLGLAVYAAVSGAIALRFVVLAFGFPFSVGSVSAIVTASDLIVFPMTIVPAANRSLVGAATLADLTAAILLLALPLPLLGRHARKGQ